MGTRALADLPTFPYLGNGWWVALKFGKWLETH